MRFVVILALLFLGTATSPASAQDIRFEQDVMYLGPTIDVEAIGENEPILCAAICRRVEGCSAFSYKPSTDMSAGYKGGLCHLKSAPGDAYEYEGVVSGRIDESATQSSTQPLKKSPEEACAAARDGAEIAMIGNMDFRSCIADLAAARKDRQICDALSESQTESCRHSAAMVASNECLLGEDHERCMIEAAVEFQNLTICNSGVGEEAKPICTMMVAAEAQDISILFDTPQLEDEERDARAAQYAVLAKDYSALEYIGDDETHDMTLIAITANRIAAGEPVGPAPCNNLSASSLDSFNRQPFQLDLYAMCVDAMALARSLAAHADTLDEIELAELVEMISSMETFDPDTDLDRLPLRMQQSFYEERARTVAQHRAANEPAPAPAQAPVMPSLETPNTYGDDDLTSDDVCILGVC